MVGSLIEYIKSLFHKEEPEAENEPALLIWGVIEGPFHVEELPPEDHRFDAEAMLVCKVSEGDQVFEAQLWWNTFDEAYEVVKHFKESIEPIRVS